MAAPETTNEAASAAHAKEVAGYLAQCLSLLPMSVYLSAEQRQRLQELSGGSGKRLRFDPEFADPARVLAMLAQEAPQTGKSGKKRKKRAERRGKEAMAATGAATSAAVAADKLPKAAKAEATRQELQARLQARLTELRARRKAAAAAPPKPPQGAPADGEGGAAAVVSGKLRRAIKRKEQFLKRRVKNLAVTNGSSGKLEQQAQKKNQGKQPPAPASTYNKEGKILYSKFDLVAKEELLGSETMGSRRAEASQKRRHKLMERRLVPTGTVGSAANVGARLERLKAAAAAADDPKKAARLAEKSRWEKALARAEGVKVKDDPAKLARTAKRQASLRRVKARKWQQREEGVQQRKAERQERRSGNIKARKDARIKKKIERSKKRGHILPELHGQ